MRARLFVEAVNRHSSERNARNVMLPEIGIRGNTHFPDARSEQRQDQDLLSQFLREHLARSPERLSPILTRFSDSRTPNRCRCREPPVDAWPGREAIIGGE